MVLLLMWVWLFFVGCWYENMCSTEARDADLLEDIDGKDGVNVLLAWYISSYTVMEKDVCLVVFSSLYCICHTRCGLVYENKCENFRILAHLIVYSTANYKSFINFEHVYVY